MCSPTSGVRSKLQLFTIWAHIREQVFFWLFLDRGAGQVPKVPQYAYRWPSSYSHRVAGGIGAWEGAQGLTYHTPALQSYTCQERGDWGDVGIIQEEHPNQAGNTGSYRPEREKVTYPSPSGKAGCFTHLLTSHQCRSRCDLSIICAPVPHSDLQNQNL